MTRSPPEPPFRERWQDATHLTLDELAGRRLDWASQPPLFKSYPDAPRLALPPAPEPAVTGASLWTSLRTRRSRRTFSGAPLPLAVVSALLQACQGVTATQGPCLLRTAPSAGALFPFETYVSLQAVEGVEPCLTHLHLPTFSLEVVASGDFGRPIAVAALGQAFLARASAVFLWTAVVPRGMWKYGDRAFRYFGLDLGHVCQNLCLAAEALTLGCCPVSAFFDDETNDLLGVDGRDELAYYLAAVGPLR